MAIEDDTLQELAENPKRMRTEEGTVEERPMKDIIQADVYQRTKTATAAVPFGMRIARTQPPGTV